MSFGPDTKEVQQILAKFLETPSINTKEVLGSLFSEKSRDNQIEIIIGVQKVFTNLFGDSYEAGLPNLFQRLEFCWKILKEADISIRRKGGKYITSYSIKNEDLLNIFGNILKTEQLHDCFLEAIGNVLYINPNFSFLKIYHQFLKPKKNLIGIILRDKDNNIIADNVKRLIWWIIRKYRIEYVDIEAGEPFKIHFPWLIKNTRKELLFYCRSREVDSVNNLNLEIEGQINAWLDYNCLQGDNAPTDFSSLKLLAKSFNKENNLKGSKILYESDLSDIDQESKKRITQLEMEVSRYAEENRKLENDKEELRKRLSLVGEDPSLQPVRFVNDKNMANSDLQDILTVIDNKYPLDALRAIQLGEEPIISMKNFVGHLFYVLRKKGLVMYPSEEEFILDYDQSGLYQCLGFEIPPDGKVQVRVEKQGWGFTRASRLFPIRKAIVRKV